MEYKKREPLELIELFTNQEAAAFLRISPVTLWRERKKGRITFRMISNRIAFLRSDLDEYLERSRRREISE